MKRGKASLLVVGVVVLALVLGMAGQAFAVADAGQGPHGRYIVIFNDDPAVNEKARDHLEALGTEIWKELPLINGYVVLLPGNLPEQALWSIPGVDWVEVDGIVQAIKGPPPWAGPKDETPAEAWGVDRIDADLAWDTTTGLGIKVAVVDTGIDVDHPDLNVTGGYNAITVIEGKAAADDDNGHGTHVAGIIAALNNEVGVTGVAYDADVYAVKVLNAAGSGYVSDVVAGITWAIDNGMQVINLSLGSGTDYESLHAAVDAAYSASIVVVAAAGNDGNPPGRGDNVAYPARYASVIAVAATNQDDARPKWSSTGPDVELAAPGVDILSTWNDGDYEAKSGTSMAAPHVAGTVALVVAANPTLAPDDVRAILQATADDLGASGWDSKYGYGLVDAEEAATGTETNP